MIARLLIVAGLLGALFGAATAQIPGAGVVFFAPKVPINASLIFTSASLQDLTATGKTSINQQKFTMAMWVKLGIANHSVVFNDFGSPSNNTVITEFDASDRLGFEALISGTLVAEVFSSAFFTDTTSWHHIVFAVDTTQATAANRIKLYYDGTLITSFAVANYPAQNTNLANNYATTYVIGSGLTGKMAQVYYIDGQQLTPSSFISGTPGNPINYSGTYTGTFDFFLNFSNGASTTTLGADSSGEGNNWTPINMTTANQSTDYP